MPRSLVQNAAFSLVEMAVVITVLGLLVGGILAGQALFIGAKRQEITVAAGTLGKAMTSFKDIYQGLPGDLTNATTHWGVASGAAPYTGSDCYNTDSSGLSDIRATCNGNGNGQTYDNGSAVYYEVFRAVQHLANAGLLAGRYTGKTGASSTSHGVPESNLPPGPLRGSALVPVSTSWRSGSSGTFFGGGYGNHVMVAAASTSSYANGAILSPNEVAEMDTKLDDGRPGTGNVVVGLPGACTNAGSIGGFSYDTPEAFSTLAYSASATKACFIIFRNY